MLAGSMGFNGAPTTGGFIIFTFLSSFILWMMIIESPLNLTINIIMSLFTWPRWSEGIIIIFILWACRNIERILGTKTFLILLLYSLIASLPGFILVSLIGPFKFHFSLLYFYPYTVFIYLLMHIPSYPVFLEVSDKLIATIIFGLQMAITFPFSILSFTAGILGNQLFSRDYFGLTKYIKVNVDPDQGINQAQREHHFPHRNQRENNSDPDISAVNTIVDMGFSEFDAHLALHQSGGNVLRAIESLISHSTL